MFRIFAAILLSPLGTLVGAWVGQYVFPDSALGHEVLVSDGVTYGTGKRAPESPIPFFFPSKLSIPLAFGTYIVVLALGAPVAELFARRNRLTWWASAGIGAVLGVATFAIAAFFFPGVSLLFGLQAYQYAAFTGAVAAIWYWALAYHRTATNSTTDKYYCRPYGFRSKL